MHLYVYVLHFLKKKNAFVSQDFFSQENWNHLHFISCHKWHLCRISRKALFKSSVSGVPLSHHHPPPRHPHRHVVIRWKGPLGTVVLRAIDVSRKGKDSSGGVCRNPRPGFPGSLSPTRRGHKNHAPFSSREMQQHMCSVSARLRLRVKRFLLGLAQRGSLCQPQPSEFQALQRGADV